jgi:hypothetical protein
MGEVIDLDKYRHKKIMEELLASFEELAEIEGMFGPIVEEVEADSVELPTFVIEFEADFDIDEE